MDDFGYNSRRTMALIAGKLGIKSGAELLGVIGSGLFSGAGGLLPLFGVPVSAGFSAMMVQGDHVHNIHRLTKEYCPEIARLTGKDKTGEPVTQDDLKIAADKNPMLKEAIEQSAKHRNWGIAISATSSVLGTIAAIAMKATVLKGAVAALGVAPALAGFTTAMAAGAVALALYFPVKWAMHAVAEHYFGLEKETVDGVIHDMRMDLARGQAVSKEQVLEVHLEAKPQLQEAIVAQFGKRFDRLRMEKKEEVVAALDAKLNITATTNAINNGTKRPEALILMDDMPVIAASAPRPAPVAVAVEARSPDGKSYVNALGYKHKTATETGSYVGMVGGEKKEHSNKDFASRFTRRESNDGLSFEERMEFSSVETAVPSRT